MKIFIKNKEGESFDITSSVIKPEDLSKIYVLKFNQNFFGDNDIFDKNCINQQNIGKEIPVFHINNRRESLGYIKINVDEEGVYIESHKLNKNIHTNNLIIGMKILDKDIKSKEEIGYEKERLFKNIEIADFVYYGD